VITPETRQLLGPNVPVISVAISDKSGSHSVAIDDEQAAYDATRHLLRLGHRRIGLLTGDPASIYESCSAPSAWGRRSFRSAEAWCPLPSTS
jgi:LacI family transcriptional regulator